MIGLKLALLAPEFIDSVVAIEASVSPHPWSRQLFLDELGLVETSRHWLVALIDDDVVGFVGSMFTDDVAHIMNVAVKPGHGGQGIASRLLRQMITDIRGGGYRSITLEVRPDNEAALALYRRFGLAPGGVRKGYYPDGQDALVLWLHEIDSPEYGERLERMALRC